MNAKVGIETGWLKFTTLKVVAFLPDTPCRALFLNVQQHNGQNPCHRCHITLVNKLVPVLEPHVIRLKIFDLVKKYILDLEELRQENPGTTRLFGVKRESILAQFSFDYVKGSPTEIMHCLFLGVAKCFLKTYVFKLRKKLSGKELKEVNDRIKMLKLPSDSKRSIRCLNEFKHYKSAECGKKFGPFFL